MDSPIMQKINNIRSRLWACSLDQQCVIIHFLQPEVEGRVRGEIVPVERSLTRLLIAPSHRIRSQSGRLKMFLPFWPNVDARWLQSSQDGGHEVDFPLLGLQLALFYVENVPS